MGQMNTFDSVSDLQVLKLLLTIFLILFAINQYSIDAVKEHLESTFTVVGEETLNITHKKSLLQTQRYQFYNPFAFNEHFGNLWYCIVTHHGELFVSSDGDDIIGLYDCDNAKLKCTVNSRKYGADLIHFTPDGKHAIHGSTKVDDAIRFLSFDRIEYLRYFSGHTKKVTSLCVSPNGNLFLSGSLDKTLRLWDLKSPKCQAVMIAMGHPIAAYDPECLLFAVGIDSEIVKLYDVREFEKGPFKTFKLHRERECEWTQMKFSNDGKSLLINTNGQMSRLIDAYDGKPLMTFTGPSNKPHLPIEASFSPDSQFVFAGSVDGRIHIWNAQAGNKVCTLDGHHKSAVQCIQFNPKYMLLASASTNLAFWLPNPDKLPK